MTARRCKECSRALPAAPRIGRPPVLCEDCSHPLKDCEACSREFRGRPGARYCSKQCSSRARRAPAAEPRWVPCAECGVSFTPKANQRFCSPGCREVAAGQRALRELHDTLRPNRLCRACQAPFHADRNQRYCPTCRSKRTR